MAAKEKIVKEKGEDFKDPELWFRKAILNVCVIFLRRIIILEEFLMRYIFRDI